MADARAPTTRRADPDREAEHRVAGVLAGLEHLDLNIVVVPPPDERFEDAAHRARDAAIVAGRHALLESATRDARDVALRAFSRSGFSGTWAATDMGASVVRAGDRVAAAAAFEGAAVAAVAEDLVDADTIEILRQPTDALRRTTGVPAPGALSTFTSRGRASAGGLQVGLAIAVVIAGVLATIAFGTIAFGLLVIAVGFALVGLIGRGPSR